MNKRTPPAAFAAMVFLALPALAANHDNWVQAKSPNFIVVSNASESDARKVAIQFEQIRALYRGSLPFVPASSTPLVTILAVRDQDSLQKLLPDYRPRGLGGLEAFFVDAPFGPQVILDLAARGDSRYAAIYLEYYHSITAPYFPHLPVWVIEGMADFYANTDIVGKEANVGMPRRDEMMYLRRHPLIPLNELFVAKYDSPTYRNIDTARILRFESGLLVRYLMLGDDGAHRAAFSAYLTALDQGANSLEAAARAFGDLEKLRGDMKVFGGQIASPILKVPVLPPLAPNDVAARPLTEAESDAYRGGFLTAQGQLKDAQPLVEEAARLDPKLALAQQNLALIDMSEKQPAEALTAISAAISLDPMNAVSRYLRAQFQFDAGSLDPNLDDDLRDAIESDANFAPAYGLLAVVLLNQNHTEDLPEAVAYAQKAVALEPGNSDYEYGFARVLAETHRYDEAEAAANRARILTSDAAQQQAVDTFLGQLSKMREASPKAAP